MTSDTRSEVDDVQKEFKQVGAAMIIFAVASVVISSLYVYGHLSGDGAVAITVVVGLVTTFGIDRVAA